ncbi:MAG: MMPL family transporter [bacterium]|nr:MMPL family transporter [bacterium]
MINRIQHPRLLLIGLGVVTVVMALFIPQFRLDASLDTLVDRNDPTVALSRSVDDTFGFGDLLVVAYQPKNGQLFDPMHQRHLANFQTDLATIDGVERVLTIRDLPVFKVPPKSLAQALSSMVFLRDADANFSNKELKKIFDNHPVYNDFLVSNDLTSTAVIIWVSKTLNRGTKSQQTEQNEALIQTIRTTMRPYQVDASLYFSGMRMIVNDALSFIRRDIVVFGVLSMSVLMLMLWFVFRQIRGVFFPMITCLVSLTLMVGLFGFLHWDVTVISSNFISVQFILNLALCLHLMVNYRQLYDETPSMTPGELAVQTVRIKFLPCLFAALTTIAGFGSLLISDILSVSTFGHMMIVGVVISFCVTFVMFIAWMSLMPRPKQISFETGLFLNKIAPLFYKLVQKAPMGILIASVVLAGLSGVGIGKLEVENRFIDYFRPSTDINRGLSYVDRHLGGTVPLNVVITFDEVPQPSDSEFDDFDDFDSVDSQSSYWFTPERVAVINNAQRYLSERPETGKVVSFGTLLQFAEQLNGEPLTTFSLNLLYEKIPDEWRGDLIDPFVSMRNNQVLFWVRMRDTNPDLKRNEFIRTLKRELPTQLGVRPDQISYSGPLILYNNMLQRLFDSQIATLGLVIAVLFGMFVCLFRSIKLAAIGIIPNALAVISILGFMGWFGISLDLMTITLAAIAMGIAVDDTIHYMYRFRINYHESGSYSDAVQRTHRTVGAVIVYTSVVIIIGFSVMVFSTFMPSVYFGLLTSLAMGMALVLTLTLLPQLLVVFRPFGPARQP